MKPHAAPRTLPELLIYRAANPTLDPDQRARGGN